MLAGRACVSAGMGGTLTDAGARHVVSAKIATTPSHDGLLVLKLHVPSGWTHLAVDADRAVVAQGYGNDEASSFAALRTVLDAKQRSPGYTQR
jgi:hypothetical protein